MDDKVNIIEHQFAVGELDDQVLPRGKLQPRTHPLTGDVFRSDRDHLTRVAATGLNNEIHLLTSCLASRAIIKTGAPDNIIL